MYFFFKQVKEKRLDPEPDPYLDLRLDPDLSATNADPKHGSTWHAVV